MSNVEALSHSVIGRRGGRHADLVRGLEDIARPPLGRIRRVPSSQPDSRPASGAAASLRWLCPALSTRASARVVITPSASVTVIIAPLFAAIVALMAIARIAAADRDGEKRGENGEETQKRCTFHGRV